ncbi:putative histone-lysine N-methyltransferase 1 [Prorops nasuta]|uniref:putative histone-lysine N-methyltransferase 1 n=1 Tax=Prorops nasuta TaxID=863751 RepID=UPI0034CE8045
MTGCCVPGCSNSTRKGFIMKVIPRDLCRREQWIKNINRKNWTPKERTYICEVHFDESMWEKTRVDGKRVLKSTAEPTVFPYNRKIYYDKNMNVEVIEKITSHDNNELNSSQEALLEEANECTRDGILANIINYDHECQNCEEEINEVQEQKTNCYKSSIKGIHDMKSKILKQHNIIKNYRKILRDLKQRKCQCKNEYKDALHNIFNEDQIKYLVAKKYPQKKIKKWSNETIRDALQLKFSCGTSGYEELLKKKLPYPL